jgi:hypothetical protein
MKGIELVGTQQERNKQINDYIGELGGQKVRRRRSIFSQILQLEFNTKRSGQAARTTDKDPKHWDDQQCFGAHEIEVQRPWGVGTDEQCRVSSRAKGQYDSVDHYTLTVCTEGCWQEAIVVCVRKLGVSGGEIMTAHVAGECPYCHYHVRY